MGKSYKKSYDGEEDVLVLNPSVDDLQDKMLERVCLCVCVCTVTITIFFAHIACLISVHSFNSKNKTVSSLL